MGRREARDIAFKVIYQLEYQKDKLEEILANTIEENSVTDAEELKYVDKVTYGIVENEADIEKRIKENLKDDWDISRISKLNIAILKIAVFEIIYMKDEIPPKASINEALGCIDLYGQPTDKTFVNGILAKILKES